MGDVKNKVAEVVVANSVGGINAFYDIMKGIFPQQCVSAHTVSHVEREKK